MIIYLTYRNADMTEGRGPMVVDKAFLHKEDANNYIDDQPGCMGRRAKWSNAKYGDWEVKEILVHEGPFDVEADKKRKAIDKLKATLNAEELKLLGIE
jgi:hypothetical protein